MPTLSVLIPVYNEKNTLLEILRRVQATPFDKELIIVDDGSTDGTRDLLAQIKEPNVKIILQEKNQGKGAALRTAIQHATGDILLVQDADLEYNPADYPQLLAPILDGRADVVYGSRFMRGGTHRVYLFWHYMANMFFTVMTNVFYNITLTDMGTCYKVFRARVIKPMKLNSNRFGFEPEVTAKVCRLNLKIYETPISYDSRTYAEGKKITWKDGLVYFWTLVRYRFFD